MASFPRTFKETKDYWKKKFHIYERRRLIRNRNPLTLPVTFSFDYFLTWLAFTWLFPYLLLPHLIARPYAPPSSNYLHLSLYYVFLLLYKSSLMSHSSHPFPSHPWLSPRVLVPDAATPSCRSREREGGGREGRRDGESTHVIPLWREWIILVMSHCVVFPNINVT